MEIEFNNDKCLTNQNRDGQWENIAAGNQTGLSNNDGNLSNDAANQPVNAARNSAEKSGPPEGTPICFPFPREWEKLLERAQQDGPGGRNSDLLSHKRDIGVELPQLSIGRDPNMPAQEICKDPRYATGDSEPKSGAASEGGDLSKDPRLESIRREMELEEQQMKAYEKAIEEWKPENFAHKVAGQISEDGLDAKTLDDLRARAASGDLDKVLDLINSDPELKKAGISLKAGEDGSITLSENGHEKQRDFVSGHVMESKLNVLEPTSPEKEAKLEQTAKEIAEEILRNGTLSPRAQEELRKQQLNRGLYDPESGEVSPTLLERINSRLAEDGRGLKLETREASLGGPPEKPQPLNGFGIGGEIYSHQLHVDLVGRDGQRQGSVYWGTSYFQRPFY